MEIEEAHKVAMMEKKIMKWELSEISELRKDLIKENYIT